MYNILVAGISIGLDLCYEMDFPTSFKYKTEKPAEYFIRVKNVKNINIVGKLINQSEFYNKYEYDGHILQHQFQDGLELGLIDYYNNEINIEMLVHNYANEYLLTQYALSYILRKNEAIILHGSSIVYNDIGIVFSAKSGTGKSTHSRLWQKYSDAMVLNDDKNILKLCGDDVYLYSSPWSGKHKLDNNIFHRLDTIVFLYQSKENHIERLSSMKAFKLLMSQLDSPKDEDLVLWNKITDKILELPIYYLGCNMEKEAFDVCKERIMEDLG